MREAGFEPDGRLDVRDFSIVLAVVDRGVGRNEKPLLARTTALAKIESASVLEYLRSRGIAESLLYEIPIDSES